MTTDELLIKLPAFIGRNKITDENGQTIGYHTDLEEGGDIGWLYVHNDGRDWAVSYGTSGKYVCLNPNDGPPYINACVYGNTHNEALQKMYDWCKKYNFI